MDTSAKPQNVHKAPHPPPESHMSQEEWDKRIMEMKLQYWEHLNPNRPPGTFPSAEELEEIPENTHVAIVHHANPNGEEMRRLGLLYADEIKKSLSMPLPAEEEDDPIFKGTFPKKLEYVPGKTPVWEKHRVGEKGLIYLSSHSDERRTTLEEGQFFMSKLPESMDRLFTSDGTVDGGILCVKNPDGSWGRGQAPSAENADGLNNQREP